MLVVNVVYWAAIAAYVVMWIGGIVTRLRPEVDTPLWAAPLFLILAAGIASRAIDVTSVLLFAAGGFAVELAGVHTGFPFGRYTYSDALGPALGGVPVVIACAWLVLLVFARDIAWRTTARRWIAVLLGAAVMMLADLLIDPVASRILGYWMWQQDGVFFGVPVVNFVGWFAVSAILLSAAAKPERPSRAALAIGTTVILFFVTIAIVA